MMCFTQAELDELLKKAREDGYKLGQQDIKVRAVNEVKPNRVLVRSFRIIEVAHTDQGLIVLVM